MAIKILIAGEPGSIHTGRFTALLQSLGFEIRLFQSTHHHAQDEHLKNIIIYCVFPQGKLKNGVEFIGLNPFLFSSKNLLFQFSIFRIIIRILHRTFSLLVGKQPRSVDLIKVIKTWQPDLVISLKMQDDGYSVSQAKQAMGESFKPKWIHFNWGTDIEFFGKHPKFKREHLPKIKLLLSQCDYLITDCQRDLDQASKFGFKGQKLGVMVGNGGHDPKFLQKLRSSNKHKKKLIIVKGRNDSLVGRSLNIIRAFSLIKPLLRDYSIKVLLGESLKKSSEFSVLSRGLNIEFVKYLSYQSILNMVAKSQIAISATTVDGTPIFLADAICVGSFPIHSDLSSVREWIKDGENGLLFPVDDVKLLSRQIVRAITDQSLRSKASVLNWQIARRRISQPVNAKILQKIIFQVLKS